MSALSNGQAWAAEIIAAYDATMVATGEITGAESNRDARALLREHGYDGNNGERVAEAICDRMRQSPLSLEVRSGWQPMGETLEPAEFCLLLTTGGPALRLIGTIGSDRFPVLQFQDWGTPWEPLPTTWAQDDALVWFASLFYFGEVQ